MYRRFRTVHSEGHDPDRLGILALQEICDYGLAVGSLLVDLTPGPAKSLPKIVQHDLDIEVVGRGRGFRGASHLLLKTHTPPPPRFGLNLASPARIRSCVTGTQGGSECCRLRARDGRLLLGFKRLGSERKRDKSCAPNSKRSARNGRGRPRRRRRCGSLRAR